MIMALNTVLAPNPRLVFIDSSAFLALLDKNDENYNAAKKILKNLQKKKVRLFTINFVIAESHALILSVLGVDVARKFLSEIEKSAISIIRVEEEDEMKAREIIFAYQDKNFSLVDAISFAVMEKFDASLAFTFDKHFKQYGLEALK